MTMNTDLFPITIEEQIFEIEREIGLRQRVYPRFVTDKKMPQARADRQIAVMQAVLATLRDLAPKRLP